MFRCKTICHCEEAKGRRGNPTNILRGIASAFGLAMTATCALLVASCGGNSGAVKVIDYNMAAVPETIFTIHDKSELIGGPLATGRVGDVLLANDKIRLIIEQPGKTPWVGNFGGGIVDMDLVRNGGEGSDNFGYMHPLINIEWTANVFNYEVIESGEAGGRIVFRTYGMLDVYDYLDLDFISPVAKALTGQNLYFAPRFDDMNDPFNLTELNGLNRTIVTEYTLEPGANYVKIDTTFQNDGNEEIALPVGDFVNGGGELQSMIPGLGFTPEMMAQIQNDTPALIYEGFDGGKVSYGYFYDIKSFMKENESGLTERLKTTSLSYSGVTGVLLGDDFLKVLPLGNQTEPKINFTIPPHEKRFVTRYLVVGNGSGGSVLDPALKVLGVSTNTVSGKVLSSSGSPVHNATVAVKNEAGSTVVTYRTDHNGNFSGVLSAGRSNVDKAFGTGRYKLAVFKQGYQMSDSSLSGVCGPEEIDVSVKSVSGIVCTMGNSGVVKIVGGVTDVDTGAKMPARLTIIGAHTTYRSETGADFTDNIIFERPLGVVDLYYVNAKGTIGLEEKGDIRLAPGRYEFVFTRGTEYSMERIPVQVSSDQVATVGPVSLKKLIDTTGYVSADFHLHSIYSPDSAMSPARRTLSAAGEGMDVLHSSDHDYLVDYGPYISALEGRGLIPAGTMTAIVGDEVSPNHLGHINYFPAPFDADKPCGGALDWSFTDSDIAGPEPDLVLSPREIVDKIRAMPGDPIIQMNHISDPATSLMTTGGWVTSPAYFKDFSVQPLSSYGDPVANRLRPIASAANYPFPPGKSEWVVTDVDTIELTIGPWLHDDFLVTSSLPMWFNLLNLGVTLTATGDSDSHREIADVLGVPRNFIMSGANFNKENYVQAIRDHKLMVSAGPFVKVVAKNDSGSIAGMGDTISGSSVEFDITVTSPDWAWFDTVELYINTEPVPMDDETKEVMKGKAGDPQEFFAPYHMQRYKYRPSKTFNLKDGTLTDWKMEEGVIKARVSVKLNLTKDSWVVVFVKGTEKTEGYRSLFPFVTHALVDADNPSVKPEEVDVGNIDTLSLTGAPAWALTNPVFIDVDGDGYEPLYRDGEWEFNGQEALKAPAPSATKVNADMLKNSPPL